jgi:hypothetical protein
MANLKISQLSPGAPAVATDLIPIDRAGANFSLQVSDIISEGIVGGGNANGVLATGVVASRVLTAQAAVDGTITNALFTVTVAGVYRIMTSINARTLSSSAWVVNADLTYPAGIHEAAQIAQAVAMNTGAIAASTFQSMSFYFHVGDVIQCGTVTASGSNTGGAFDVAWVVERLV